MQVFHSRTLYTVVGLIYSLHCITTLNIIRIERYINVLFKTKCLSLSLFLLHNHPNKLSLSKYRVNSEARSIGVCNPTHPQPHSHTHFFLAASIFLKFTY